MNSSIHENVKRSTAIYDTSSAEPSKRSISRETAQQKFKKWLEKGKPNYTVATKHGENRRSEMGNLIASERNEENSQNLRFN